MSVRDGSGRAGATAAWRQRHGDGRSYESPWSPVTLTATGGMPAAVAPTRSRRSAPQPGVSASREGSGRLSASDGDGSRAGALPHSPALLPGDPPLLARCGPASMADRIHAHLRRGEAKHVRAGGRAAVRAAASHDGTPAIAREDTSRGRLLRCDEDTVEEGGGREAQAPTHLNGSRGTVEESARLAAGVTEGGEAASSCERMRGSTAAAAAVVPSRRMSPSGGRLEDDWQLDEPWTNPEMQYSCWVEGREREGAMGSEGSEASSATVVSASAGDASLDGSAVRSGGPRGGRLLLVDGHAAVYRAYYQVQGEGSEPRAWGMSTHLPSHSMLM